MYGRKMWLALGPAGSLCPSRHSGFLAWLSLWWFDFQAQALCVVAKIAPRQFQANIVLKSQVPREEIMTSFSIAPAKS